MNILFINWLFDWLFDYSVPVCCAYALTIAYSMIRIVRIVRVKKIWWNRTYGKGVSFQGIITRFSHVFHAIPASVKSAKRGNDENVCLPVNWKQFQPDYNSIASSKTNSINCQKIMQCIQLCGPRANKLLAGRRL